MHIRRISAALLVSVLIGVSACGEKEKKEGTLVGGGGSVSTPPEATAPATPTELGEAAGKIYADTLTGVSDAMASNPEAADLKAKLTALRDAAIPKLVDLGKKRKALDAPGQARMDSALAMAMNTVPSKVFEAFSAGQQKYAKADNDLGNLISSFNVITQYANFDLLKQQLPEEAKRLGVE